MSDRYLVPAADYALIAAALPNNYAFGVTTPDGHQCITAKEVERINSRPPQYLQPAVAGVSDSYYFTKSMDDICQELFSSDWATYAAPYRDPKYRIWELTEETDEAGNWNVLPAKLDYKKLPSGQLYPNRTFVQGELTKVTWHPDESFLQDPWIQVDIVYTRTTGDFALYRVTSRKWLRDDDTWGPTVDKKKLYYPEPAAVIKEGKIRRGNVFDYTVAVTFGYLEATAPIYQGVTDVDAIKALGQSFLSSHQQELEGFIEYSRTDILTNITNDTSTWLDNVIDVEGTTIRDFVYLQFDIWS